MKKVMLTICLIGMFVSVQGCTNAGPFVTDISSDGNGGLVITKSTVVLDPFLGVIRDGDKSIVYTIKVDKD